MIKWLLILTMLFSGLNLSAENDPPGWFTKTNINGVDVIISINPPFYDSPKFHSDPNSITNRDATITNINFISEIQDIELSSLQGVTSKIPVITNIEGYSELDLVKIKLARFYDCGDDNTIIRTCVVNRNRYMVQYTYYPNGPSYFVNKKEHWPAFIMVSKYDSLWMSQESNRKIPISENGVIGKFVGELVLGGGSEDIPQNMVYQALGLTNRVTESKDWIAESAIDKLFIKDK